MPYSKGSKYSLGMDMVEEANMLGKMFYTRSKFVSVAPNTSIDMAIQVGTENLFIVGRNFTYTTDKLTLEVYSGPTFTGGTPIPIIPYNSISPKASFTSGLLDVSTSNTGTLFDEDLFIGKPDNNQSRVGGGFVSNTVLRPIPANSTFLLRFINEGTVPLDGVFKYLFFERDVGIPLI